ncbi:maleylacetate reductase and hydroxyquinol 1,2-dioxygenase domain-containing protein [Arthrobacter sp. NPDC090010]|uniref:maleylacetate reductase and hydroxyquinol 1,2-dioxygenase domain-containing protein n=1 Tax=Arthrobacter sp. NPDC090010 TaxID=3363942 RepID=UPI0037F8677F
MIGPIGVSPDEWSFIRETANSKVVFGPGCIARIAEELRLLGVSRAILVSGGRTSAGLDQLERHLGSLLVARFEGAEMHTPKHVTAQALNVATESGVDCIVSLGGGSATGLAKALGRETGLPTVVIPTSYAGSEATPVLGETEDGVKTTISAPEILPNVVLYDVDLTLDMPLSLTVNSALNAMAHAVEALYAPTAVPAVFDTALRAIGLIGSALPVLLEAPRDVVARVSLLEGAWLAGSCLGLVGMGLHHKLCHVLGGSFGLPHAATHAIVLPYVVAFNATSIPHVIGALAEALKTQDVPAKLWDLAHLAGPPDSLAGLGFAPEDIERAVAIAIRAEYPNPRPVTPEGVRQVLEAAINGKRPSDPLSEPDLDRLTQEVTASFAQAADSRLRSQLTGLVRHLHAFVREEGISEDEWTVAIDFLTKVGQMSSDVRQETVLLSDVLGISSVVDALTNSRTPQSTPSAVLGPFYTEGPPQTPLGSDIAGPMEGDPLWVDVRILDRSGAPIAGAVVDVWQSNDEGFYDLQLPDLDGPVLRARFESAHDGSVKFWSIKPCEYPIPTDGPVGALLRATNRHPYRAPHVHFMISAPGFHRLVTQLFVAGGAYLDSDTVFGVKPELVVEFLEQTGATPDGRALGRPWYLLKYDFTLGSAG